MSQQGYTAVKHCEAPVTKSDFQMVNYIVRTLNSTLCEIVFQEWSLWLLKLQYSPLELVFQA